jgi:hypothetical protein
MTRENQPSQMPSSATRASQSLGLGEVARELAYFCITHENAPRSTASVGGVAWLGPEAAANMAPQAMTERDARIVVVEINAPLGW